MKFSKKVMVFGTFDVLHRGHLSLFEQAKSFGDYLIAVVARDKNVLSAKGKLPRHNESERLRMVMKQVDKAMLGYVYEKYKVIEKFKPDVICLGYDQEASLEDLKRFKIKIVRLKPHKPDQYKSSKIK